MNAFAVQEKLKMQQTVSVPWLLITFHLSYKQARELLSQLIRLGWVEPEPSGLEYRTYERLMKLRKIEPSEVPRLIEAVSQELMTILAYIADNPGATAEEVSKALVDKNNGKPVLRALVKARLIIVDRGRYYVRVSDRAIRVLHNVERTKRIQERLSIHDSDGAENDRLVRLFDELFEE